jgi:polyisoprenoid-binding protein YceI
MAIVRLLVSPAAAIVLILATPVMSVAQATPQSGVYMLDRAASLISFTLYGSAIFKIKKNGYFKDFSGLVSYNPARPADTRVDLTVVANSIDMRNTAHDQLLKSGDFFDVAHYPTLHFASESANVQPDGTLAMTGDMTIRGVTKRMTIPVTLRRTTLNGTTPGTAFESTFQIDRTEFGLNGSASRYGLHVSISKKVQIHIAIATRPSTPQSSK